MRIFTDTITGKLVRKGAKCDTICSNTTSWWADNLDNPYQCEDSCLEKQYGCQACTNPDYFHCKIDGEQHCLHPELVCDGHVHCDPATDEALTDACIERKIKLGDITATNYTTPCNSTLNPSKYFN